MPARRPAVSSFCICLGPSNPGPGEAVASAQGRRQLLDSRIGTMKRMVPSLGPFAVKPVDGASIGLQMIGIPSVIFPRRYKVDVSAKAFQSLSDDAAEVGFVDITWRGAGRLPWLYKSMVMRGLRPH